VKAQEKAFAGELLDPDQAALRAIELSKKAKKPIVLADVQDNPGAVIGMIVDEGAAKEAVETGEGNIMRRGIGAVVGYGGETPLEADWRVVKLSDGIFTGTGPFYGGAKFQIGPMALVTDEASGVSAVLACKRVQAADKEMFRTVGVEPADVPILGLKSTVHFRADFQPIAETILVVQSTGAHITDPVDMPYKHLRKGIKLKPMGPVHSG
jgi:microcystin degradation protein MlrC